MRIKEMYTEVCAKSHGRHNFNTIILLGKWPGQYDFFIFKTMPRRYESKLYRIIEDRIRQNKGKNPLKRNMQGSLFLRFLLALSRTFEHMRSFYEILI